MELTRRTTAILITLIAASLLGLVALQAVLLDGVRRQKDRAFDRAARTALAQVATQLDAGEVLHRVMVGISSTDSTTFPGRARVFGLDRGHDGAVLTFDGPVRISAERDSLLQTWVVGADGEDKAELLNRIFSDLGRQAGRPVTERLNLARVDSLLPLALREAGVAVAVEYGVLATRPDTLVVASPRADRAALAASPYRTRLFPTDFFAPTYELVACFPGRAAWAWRQLAPLLLASVVLTALVVLCTVYGVRTILAQRRFASELVSFVDNLTHELKTPLATMALASEAMARDDVRGDAVTLGRYSGMIGDEVRRLRGHVDRILQLAHLERGELAIEREPVDVHEVLRPIIDGFGLQIAARGGTLAVRLDASPSRVLADPVHLAGMVANLLDNAVKYSPGTPAIELVTSGDGGRLRIRVYDRGVGVPTAMRRRVFERYVRCQRGDRHDVKGFGLGLAYVSQMAARHHGTVDLDGRAGGGTVVTVDLPALRESES
ncbi:MAG: ATP-binding protein [Candidatus Krumholzibacteriia bacterium]